MIEKANWTLGVDLGTSSCKICLINEKGNRIANAKATYHTYSPSALWMEQNPQDWLQAVTEAVTSLGKESNIDLRRVGSIGLTSAAHIGVLLDKQNTPLRKAILWSDQRSTKQSEKLLEKEDLIYNIAGNRPSTSWTLPHFLWVKDNEPEIWSKIERLCFSKDYLIYWMTGNWVTDPGTAVSSMLYDYRKNSWSEKLCSIIGIKPSQLPSVSDATTKVGTLTTATAKVLGITEGIPIINGSLDSATETYAAGARLPGDVVIRIGTAGGIHKLSKEPIQNPKLLTYPFLSEGIWYSQAGTNSAGSAIKWAVGLNEDIIDNTSFDEFSNLAQEALPGSDDIFFHPYLAGERTPYWNPKLRGTFTGLSFHHEKKHMARAVLEGVAFSLFDALQTILNDGEIPNRIMVVGGGASDPLLMDILSSLLNVPLMLLPSIDSSLGAAQIGQKILKFTMTENDTIIEKPLVVSPTKEWVPIYAKSFNKYKMYCNVLKILYN